MAKRKKGTSGFGGGGRPVLPKPPRPLGQPLAPPGSLAPVAASPVDSGPPPDPYFDAQKAAANRNLQFGDASDAYQKAQIENRYGFGTDTSNPYSVANLLQQSYQKGQKATSLGMASQGQLYSGALQSKLEEGTNQYNIGVDSAKRDYSDALFNIIRGKAQRVGSTVGDVSNDQLEALLRALGGK